MVKKNKIKDVEAAVENVAIAEELASVKKNGSASNGMKKDKKKKSMGLTVNKTNGADKELKTKKKKLLKDDNAEAGEELISFKKPSKKRTAEPENSDEEVPTKVSKANGNLISAGTTIDQIVGVKLNPKKGKRQKKRENHAEQIEEQKKKSKAKEREEIRQYLNCWSTNRTVWKFHKLRQIYIQDHAFDEDEINADLWPIALDYLSGSKGASKDVLVKKAESIIREGDAAAAGEGDDTLQASSKYERARELLQCLG